MPGEKEIIRRIRQGDIRSFETLFRSSYVSLVRYAGSLVKDTDTAEEIVQELFTSLWQERKNLKIKSTVTGYLFRSVHNRCLHHLEHLRVVGKHRDAVMAGSDILTASADDEVNYAELQKTVADVIENLPGKCGQIFIMSRFDGLKYREISEKLGVSVKTVESCMGRALREFRKILFEHGK
ncbi:MAG TPA: RNA polymerase sigma-70 factor [Bacteroidales bacterium]|nr:RNA polymerase sigma-70 factor [Bacteroidales bacterium]HRR93556.1 RNA polymerase sigma-70 factor [Bacteroidales bacterium]HRT90105.1 RNA polymerase sigma-70 factor [Bacteroidales bacterium]